MTFAQIHLSSCTHRCVGGGGGGGEGGGTGMRVCLDCVCVSMSVTSMITGVKILVINFVCCVQIHVK